MDHALKERLGKIAMAVLLLFSASWVAYTFWQDMQSSSRVVPDVKIEDGRGADLVCYYMDGSWLYCIPAAGKVGVR